MMGKIKPICFDSVLNDLVSLALCDPTVIPFMQKLILNCAT